MIKIKRWWSLCEDVLTQQNKRRSSSATFDLIVNRPLGSTKWHHQSVPTQSCSLIGPSGHGASENLHCPEQNKVRSVHLLLWLTEKHPVNTDSLFHTHLLWTWTQLRLYGVTLGTKMSSDQKQFNQNCWPQVWFHGPQNCSVVQQNAATLFHFEAPELFHTGVYMNCTFNAPRSDFCPTRLRLQGLVRWARCSWLDWPSIRSGPDGGWSQRSPAERWKQIINT